MDPKSTWNSEEFEIEYLALKDNLYVSGFYLKYLIPLLANKDNTELKLQTMNRIQSPSDILIGLHQAIVIEDDADTTLEYLYSYRVLLECFPSLIPAITTPFIPYLIWILDLQYNNLDTFSP